MNYGEEELRTGLSLSEHDFNRIAEFITGNYGIKLPSGKRTMVESRLADRVIINNFSSFGNYVQWLFSREGATEKRQIIEYISTNETWFFRESDHFKYMSTHLKRVGFKGKLRVWSSACSSGEEPYSIAMSLDDLRQTELPDMDFKIFCTDISNDILNVAARGQYYKRHLDNVKSKYVTKYFDLANPERPVIVKELKNRLSFRQFNLVDEADFRGIGYKFDVIFCRNVLIYFNLETQQKVIAGLLSKLKPGGLFIIGHTETLVLQRFPQLLLIRPAMYQLLA